MRLLGSSLFGYRQDRSRVAIKFSALDGLRLPVKVFPSHPNPQGWPTQLGGK